MHSMDVTFYRSRVTVGVFIRSGSRAHVRNFPDNYCDGVAEGENVMLGHFTRRRDDVVNCHFNTIPAPYRRIRRGRRRRRRCRR